MSSSMPLTMDQRRLSWPTFLLSLLLLQATANAIDLSRLYGHMANPIQKRSGKRTLFFLIFICIIQIIALLSIAANAESCDSIKF